MAIFYQKQKTINDGDSKFKINGSLVFVSCQEFKFPVNFEVGICFAVVRSLRKTSNIMNASTFEYLQ